MADLYANVDGEMVPLSECTWVFSYPCGHPFGLLLAEIPESGGIAYATEEQAWTEFYTTAAKRRAARARGVRASLANTEKLRVDDELWDRMKAGCQCAPEVNRR